MGKLLARRKAVSHFAKSPGSGSIEHCSMSSDILGINKEFSVYLPTGYEEGDTRYPVLYLLHPAGGTHENWINMGELPQIADDAIRSGMALPMIIVMPDASGAGDFHLGKHLGFFSVPGWDYESYFHKELIPLIDSSYRTVADRKHRAITGASMGGEAAISYAQKHPDMYGASCALCGIVGHPEQSRMAQSDKDYADSLIANNPTAFVENATPETVEQLKGIRWYADCGDNDFFYEGNVAFYLTMKSKSIPIEYRMRSGVHGWYYWVTGLAPILHFLSIGFAE
ncbi:MAG: esterase family protein [Muribaculaceae bacterium]|nr:esterase family protein [Muribaculaceae bacterium]